MQLMKVGYTPSDIFNSILLGKAVFLDHGFDLVPGFRTITIYAHLSHIEEKYKGRTKGNWRSIVRQIWEHWNA